MSKDKTYILRRPIKAKRMNSENWRDIFEVDMPASWDAEQSITYELQEDDFNKTFVELDVAGLTRQVEELADIHFYKDLDPNYQVYQYTETGLSGLWILEYKPDKEQLLAGTKEQCFEQWMSFSEPYIDKKKTEIKEFAEQVVLLLLNQEKETK